MSASGASDIANKSKQLNYWHSCFRSYHLDNMDVYHPFDLVHPLPDPPADDAVDETAFPLVGSHKEALADTPCISYLSCLLTLAPQMLCPQCGSKCPIQHKIIGSAIVLLWVSNT